MATLAIQPIKFVCNTNGGSSEHEKKVLTSGTAIAGDLGILTNDAITLASADPTNIAYLIPNAGTSTTNQIIPGDAAGLLNVIKIKPGDVYEISIYHSTPASAIIAASDVDGTADYGVIKSTVTGQPGWCLDLEETSTQVVRLIKALGTYGDVYQRVQVQFLQTPLTFGAVA